MLGTPELADGEEASPRSLWHRRVRCRASESLVMWFIDMKTLCLEKPSALKPPASRPGRATNWSLALATDSSMGLHPTPGPPRAGRPMRAGEPGRKGERTITMVKTHETDALTWLNGREKKYCPLLEKFLPTFGTSASVSRSPRLYSRPLLVRRTDQLILT